MQREMDEDGKASEPYAEMLNAEIDRIGYALAKQVSDMERGFTIQTRYGDLVIDAEDAADFAALARRILREKLRCMERRRTAA